MECLTAKSKIQETLNEVTELANQKNVKALREEAVNNFLDKISMFRTSLEEKLKLLPKLIQNLRNYLGLIN